MSAVKKILIIGGGITGLTAAAALRLKGFDVDLIEIRKDVDSQVGVGLTLVGNALAALDRIGVAQTCIALGMPANDMKFRKPDGSPLADMPDAMLGGPGLPGHVSMSRYDLHKALILRAAELKTNMRLGVGFETIRDQGDAVDVMFSDGASGRYDLVIGADGAYSKTRALLFPGIEPQSCHQAVWRAAVPRPPEVITSYLHFQGPLGVVGICPISRENAYLYIVENAPGNPRFAREALPEVMREKVKDYGGLVPGLAATLGDPDTVSYRPLEWHLLPDPWYKGRVIVIGDAAHTNPPVLAQGAAMGIEDAVVLAEELDEKNAIDQALKTFMARRFARVDVVVRNSVQLATWEVEHTPGIEIAAVWRETNEVLARAI